VKRPTIWKYGQLELVFSPADQVTFIALQLWQTEHGLPERLGLDVDLPGGLAMDEALVRVATAGLGAELIPALTHDDQVSFRVPSSGVQLHFIEPRSTAFTTTLIRGTSRSPLWGTLRGFDSRRLHQVSFGFSRPSSAPEDFDRCCNVCTLQPIGRRVGERTVGVQRR
jgi:hypothetical protein